MYRGKQFHSIRRFKASYDRQHSFKQRVRFSVLTHELASLVHCLREDFDLAVGFRFVTESTREVTLHDLQNLVQIVSVWPVCSGLITQPQRLATDLKKIS